MTLDELKARIPDHAKDVRLNLSSLERQTALTDRQLAGTLLAVAASTRRPDLLRAIEAHVRPHLDEPARKAALIAASLMAMNNVYYRFVHLVSDPEYGTLPAGLRMQAIANPGVDKIDFELFSLAVSALNGCGMCMDSHEQALRRAGVSREAIQAAVKIAAILSSVAATLAIEDAITAAA
jgi:alkyl hydroperoxide reductase subunit D